MMRAKKGQFIMGAISLLSNEFNGFGDNLIKGLTYKQWFLLMMISRMRKKGCNLNAIADFAGTTRQNVKKMLIQLEKNGYVTVKKSGEDARSLSVELTRKAYNFLKTNDERIAIATEKLFSPLGDEEMDALTMLLKKTMYCIENYSDKHVSD